MIKRRFYKFEHGDKDNVSGSSSSSSDSELDMQASEESESEPEPEKEVAAQVKQNDQACSTSSGYKSEDSSANEVGVDSAGLIDDDNDDSDETEDYKQIFINTELHTRRKKLDTPKEPLPDDFPACILRCKSVFKCKLCPRIVCLNEESIRAHFNSKKHARSEKLLKEGRLKTMLDSDGEIKYLETSAETYAPVPQGKQKKKLKGGRHRRGKDPKRKRMRDEKQSTKDRAKRGRKNEN